MTADELNAARLKLGLSQVQLSKVLGITDRSVRRLLAGHREISGPIGRVMEALDAGWRPADFPQLSPKKPT